MESRDAQKAGGDESALDGCRSCLAHVPRQVAAAPRIRDAGEPPANGGIGLRFDGLIVEAKRPAATGVIDTGAQGMTGRAPKRTRDRLSAVEHADGSGKK